MSSSHRKNEQSPFNQQNEVDHPANSIDPRLRDTASTSSPITYHNPIAPAPPSTQFPQQYASPLGNPYLPHTPQSGGNVANHGSANLGSGTEESRRTRACESCRGLKVKCEPDLNNPDGPCKRCAKASRNCVIAQKVGKKRRKSDTRVAELEKKIDALTQSLAQKSGGIAPPMPDSQPQGMNIHPGHRHAYQQVTNGGFSSPYVSGPEVRAEEWTGYKGPSQEMSSAGPPMVIAGQKRKHAEIRDSAPVDGPRNTQGSWVDPSNKSDLIHEYADVVDRGLLTVDIANKLFECYIEKMVPHMPAVVFPFVTTASDVRKNTPTLFLAILSAASGSNYPELQRVFNKELMSIFAERVIVRGEKTLELVQALQVSTLWYWPPEHFEELKFYQLIHTAAVMALDIGMGRKNKARKGKPIGLWRDTPWRRTPFPDPESIEARRAWLTCYFLCCNASMNLRRPNLIRWSSFMSDCVDVLDTSPEAAPTDKVLCQWVRSQHIGEEVGARFALDEPLSSVTLADADTQYALKGFELDFEKWENKMSPEQKTPTLIIGGHAVNIYMHEVAMRVDRDFEATEPPFTEERVDNDKYPPLTNAHVGALTACLKSIHGTFETFLGFDIETIRCLPIANFVRIAYAVVALVKMHFTATHSSSELGKIIAKDDMKVEYYLDRLVAIFKATAAEEKSRASARFLMVLLMLKTWFHRQRRGGQPVSSNEPASKSEKQNKPSSDNSEIAQNSNAQQQNGQQSSYSPANTPLQLLSEVATGNSGGQSRPESMANYPGGNNDWQQPPSYTQNYAPMTTLGLNHGFDSGAIHNFDTSDYGYTIDGLEQAMGIPLGDFGGIFDNDNFFTGYMDSMGQGGFE